MCRSPKCGAQARQDASPNVWESLSHALQSDRIRHFRISGLPATSRNGLGYFVCTVPTRRFVKMQSAHALLLVGAGYPWCEGRDCSPHRRDGHVCSGTGHVLSHRTGTHGTGSGICQECRHVYRPERHRGVRCRHHAAPDKAEHASAAGRRLKETTIGMDWYEHIRMTALQCGRLSYRPVPDDPKGCLV